MSRSLKWMWWAVFISSWSSSFVLTWSILILFQDPLLQSSSNLLGDKFLFASILVKFCVLTPPISACWYQWGICLTFMCITEGHPISVLCVFFTVQIGRCTDVQSSSGGGVDEEMKFLFHWNNGECCCYTKRSDVVFSICQTDSFFWTYTVVAINK